jgi:hypothetical protein
VAGTWMNKTEENKVEKQDMKATWGINKHFNCNRYI